ncbi:cleft lip and palate transmembrane protein 1-like protein [Homarus americanus]|uniref:Lipid scramblase CLPTM1L n=1 Tax=Homarus americanus TaxID=6706 RepID=A0A8J5JUQ7_HOMAM|nr:cleft lip and palate transmembrane protein 1-like protein [Homarus americanus]XP_042235409.1 cleft lip and palate transmembrane protein 1-like protein [Homarus americanus]XP_042235411.1 cleft lip and palate transmembrane protein 1-like protein [Homarus americanus]KAG7161338.1 Cleft lip and palate transmembrane protein 1-like 2 [Homarus americanus]
MALGYQFPSLTTIICGVFVAYVIQSTWTLGQLFIPPNCPDPTQCIHPLIAQDPKLQLLAFTSQKIMPEYASDLRLVHQVQEFDYSTEKETVVLVPIPKKVRNNGTMYLHIFLTSSGVDPDDWGSVVNDELSVYGMAHLTQFHIPDATTFNLLGKENEKEEKPSDHEQKPVTHFQSVVVFNVLTHTVSLPRKEMPYDIGHSLRIHSSGRYLPILYVDRLSARLRDLVEVKSSSVEANLTLKYSPISYGKLRLWMQFEGALTPMAHLGFTPKDLDEVKGIFSDTNLYFLFITFLVAALHMLFDFLAFKNDISFWRTRKTMAGISTSSVAWRAISQIIIFLYLMDENTSMLVLVPAGVGGIIELWKVTKAFHIKFHGWRPRFHTSRTSAESATQELDSQGIKYLSYLLYPLIIGGAVYSLMYTPHKSWYSWVINCLVNGVYAFGFLFMLPQLFINYKLKSVAHLPWKAFMYKAFNTFIDDLFAFIITMPTAHRVACFRDDIVFVIYLVQRWLYPVDKSRLNEFGESGEEKQSQPQPNQKKCKKE